jgi:hypothetical protein
MGRVRVVPAAGTVFHGMGTVWENPTRGLPVLNPIYVMKQRMEFQNIKVFVNLFVNEDIFVGVETVQSFLHPVKSIHCMGLVLSIVNEIKKAMGGRDKTRRGYTSENAKKNFLHLCVLFQSTARSTRCPF